MASEANPTEAIPTDKQARRIAARFGDVSRCDRFPTGLRNWVYDVAFESQAPIVVRLSLPENRAELRGAAIWTELLREAGVPVAEVLASDLDAAQPYLVLERLAGTDLGNIFSELTETELDAIASSVAAWQVLAQSSLDPAAGYGFAHSYSDPGLHDSWSAALGAQLDRSERMIQRAGVADATHVPAVRAWLHRSIAQTQKVKPLPFLHDATTKNVIVHDGRAAGLVDVDQMAFGDPLYIAALARMSLLAAQRSPRYAEHLASLLASDIGLLDLYTAVHCVGFLAELGQRFNQSQPAAVDPTFHAHLITILSDLLP